MTAPDLAAWMGRLTLAARRLRRAPAFTVVSVLLLGAGMSIAAAGFTLVNVALFKTPAGTEHLAHVALFDDGVALPRSVAETVRRSPPEAFAMMGGFSNTRSVAVVAAGASHPSAVEAIAGAYFTLFGAQPVTGRLVNGNESADIAVISDRFWRRIYDSTPDVIGQQIVVAGRQLTIAGVVRTPVRPGRTADVWVPSHVLPISIAFGQLRDGVTIAQASSEVAARYGPFLLNDGSRRLFVRDGMSAPLRPADVNQLVWLFSLALVTSLTASASFGLLLFARLVSLQGQLAIRLTLGATVRELGSLLTAEVIILGVLSAAVAVFGGDLLVRFVIAQFSATVAPVHVDLAPDWRVFVSVGLLTLIVGLAVAARLGWSIVRLAALGSMVATSGVGGATLRIAGASSRLIAGQSAATAALLLLAALVMRAALPHRAFTHGLDTDGSLVAWIDSTAFVGRPAEGTQQIRQLQKVAQDLSPFATVAAVSSLPGGISNTAWPRATNGHEFGRSSARTHYVTSTFFEAFGLNPTRGRLLDAAEDESALPVAVVSRTAAARLWPDVDPIGRNLWLNRDDGTSTELTVIGEVEDVAFRESWSDTGDVYVPLSQRSGGVLGLVVHVDPARGRAIPPDVLESSLQRAFPDVGLTSVRTLDAELHERSAPSSFIPRVLGALGLLVFIVAMGGLYGLMSYLAVMRRREMGIRRALGATSLTLCRMLTRETSTVLLIGLGLGLVTAVAIGMLFVTEHTPFRPFDPVAIATVIPTLYVAGLIAAVVPFIPAMRARTLDLQKD